MGGEAPELVGVLHHRVFPRNGGFARIMSIDDRQNAICRQPRNGEPTECLARDLDAFDFVRALKFRIFRVRTHGLRKLLRRKFLPTDVVHEDRGQNHRRVHVGIDPQQRLTQAVGDERVFVIGAHVEPRPRGEPDRQILFAQESRHASLAS